MLTEFHISAKKCTLEYCPKKQSKHVCVFQVKSEMDMEMKQKSYHPSVPGLVGCVYCKLHAMKSNVLHSRFQCNVKSAVEHWTADFTLQWVLLWSTVQFLREDSSKENLLYFGSQYVCNLFTYFSCAQCFTLAKFHIKLPAIGLLSVPAPPQESNTKPFSQNSKC